MSAEKFAGIERRILNLLEENLSPRLCYHNTAHTIDVLKEAQVIAAAENITGEKDLLLLKTAALFHDIGFVKVYAMHEKAGCEITRELLGDSYEEEDIREICNLIMTTALPQKPYDKLSAILCDADLDYLGRDDFFRIGQTLKEEWFNYGIIQSDIAFEERQLLFLKSHDYFTDYSLSKRKPVKQRHLNLLLQENGIG